eukprot:Lankesteria_metandrocarpae@DN9567_c0_g1_i1.p1
MQSCIVPPPPRGDERSAINGNEECGVVWVAGQSQGATERPPLPQDASSDWNVNAVKLEADLKRHYFSLKQKDFDSRNVAKLEFSRYLENVVWPGFKHLVSQFTKMHSDTTSAFMTLTRRDDSDGGNGTVPSNDSPANRDGQNVQSFRVGGVTKEHMLFIVLMINEKSRQRVNVWQMLDLNDDSKSTKDSTSEATESFGDLFYRIAAMSHTALKSDLTLSERSLLVVFFVQCFQSLERQEMCNICLRFCGLPILYHLTQKQRNVVLQREPMYSA